MGKIELGVESYAKHAEICYSTMVHNMKIKCENITCVSNGDGYCDYCGSDELWINECGICQCLSEEEKD